MNYFPLTRSVTIRFLHIVIKKSTLSIFNVDFLLDLSENKRDFNCLQLIDYQVFVQFIINHLSFIIT